ncbi:YlmC/YmxH family sporulation protein [Effusibacillus pohliae]|uniref:YlmC/YmxH family sporulation protein n=1 Tax=Effusibacillus pohliae TaxID=232270 RepID=UPI00036B7259|nr:YlmC/YmxH family sporulation protein [Effusibacillus pohliae]
MVKVSELQSKDVVNIGDGKRLGMIGDLDIDVENGMVRAIVVPGSGRFFGIFGSSQDYVIPWSQIVKIGADVVLVELNSFAGPYASPSQGGRRPGNPNDYDEQSGGY